MAAVGAVTSKSRRGSLREGIKRQIWAERCEDLFRVGFKGRVPNGVLSSMLRRMITWGWGGGSLFKETLA